MRLRHLLIAFVAVLVGCMTIASGAFAKQVEITINKISQKMTVRVDGDTEYVWPVSTGAAGYETPGGKWKPFRMEAEHFSKEWDDAPMPHSIFFTPRGHAIHGSYHVKSLGRRASHGCVRLHPDNAAILFSLVQSAGMSNTKVYVRGGFFDFGTEPRKTKPWFTSSGGFGDTKKRSFASINSDIEKTTKPAKKKPKKVALKCTTKNGKKVCKKPFLLFSGAEG